MDYEGFDLSSGEIMPEETPMLEMFADNPEEFLSNSYNEQETEGTIDAVEGTETDEVKGFAFDEYFATPEEFESHEEALGWYQNQMDTLKRELMNPENGLTRQYIDNYVSTRLSEEEERIVGFAEAYSALISNPKEYLMQYVPEALVAMGIEPVKTPDELMAETDKLMQQEFGEDYMHRFNPSELIRHNSHSSQLLQRRSEISNYLEQQNQQNKDLFQNWNKNITEGKSNLPDLASMQLEEQIGHLKENHMPKFMKDYNMSEQAFDKFARDIAQREVTLEDLHRVQYFEGYMKQAYQKGLEDAKSGLYNKLNSEGNATKRTASSIKPTVKTQQSSFLNTILSNETRIPSY